MAHGFNALYNNTDWLASTRPTVLTRSFSTPPAVTISRWGSSAGNLVTTADNVICIAANGANVSNTTWIGGVYGTTTQSATTTPVIVSDNGQLGTAISSERFKKDISTMEKASEVIRRPARSHSTTRDAKGTPQFGLIAEEVAKVNPALALPDKEGKPYTVQDDQVMRCCSMSSSIRRQIDVQQKQIEALTAGLQKVSAQLKLAKPKPQMVLNDQSCSPRRTQNLRFPETWFRRFRRRMVRRNTVLLGLRDRLPDYKRQIHIRFGRYELG